jgi:hypothetical protein
LTIPAGATTLVIETTNASTFIATARAATAPTRSTTMTIGSNQDRRATATMMRARSVAVPATTREPLIPTSSRVKGTTFDGKSAIVEAVSVTRSQEKSSRGSSTCRADPSGRSCVVVTASTPYADRRFAHSRPSARFELSRVVIFEITRVVPRIHAQAICDTSASKD